MKLYTNIYYIVFKIDINLYRCLNKNNLNNFSFLYKN